MVDIHTHLIPGVDDGARSLQDSVAMARVAAEDGISALVATPHAVWDGHILSGDSIRSGVDRIRIELQKQGIHVRVIPGAEVRMDPDLPDLLRRDLSWTIDGKGSYLLLEPPWGPLPSYHESLVRELIAQGITPIIAHPERSPGVQADPHVVDRWLSLGALTQVTASSLTREAGAAGTLTHAAGSLAHELLRAGWVDVVSSDAHNAVNRAPLLGEARAVVSRLVGEEAATRLFVENPECIISGTEVGRGWPRETSLQSTTPLFNFR